MKYMGSKSRHAKEILKIILADRKPGQWFIETMVGGGNVIENVDGNRLGADIQPYVIATLKAASQGWLPPSTMTEEEYYDLRDYKDFYPEELVGYAGFALSYGGKWFGGWCRDKDRVRNYADESYRNALKQFPKLKGATFVCSSYDELELPPGKHIIYCDPPYKGTTCYTGASWFKHDKFWQWVRDKTKEGHRVFVSEYVAPDDFTCIWAKDVRNDLTNKGNSRAVEKLFRLFPKTNQLTFTFLN